MASALSKFFRGGRRALLYCATAAVAVLVAMNLTGLVAPRGVPWWYELAAFLGVMVCAWTGLHFGPLLVAAVTVLVYNAWKA